MLFRYSRAVVTCTLQIPCKPDRFITCTLPWKVRTSYLLSASSTELLQQDVTGMVMIMFTILCSNDKFEPGNRNIPVLVIHCEEPQLRNDTMQHYAITSALFDIFHVLFALR